MSQQQSRNKNRRGLHPLKQKGRSSNVAKRMSSRLRFKDKMKMMLATAQQRRPAEEQRNIDVEMETHARSTIPGSTAHKVLYLNTLGLLPKTRLGPRIKAQILKIKNDVKQATALAKALDLKESEEKSDCGNNLNGNKNDVEVVFCTDPNTKLKHMATTTTTTTSDSGYDSSSSLSPVTVIYPAVTTNSYGTFYLTESMDIKQFCEVHLKSTAAPAEKLPTVDLAYLKAVGKRLSALGTELDFV